MTSGTAVCLKAAEQRSCGAPGFAMAQLSLAAALSFFVALVQGASWNGLSFWVLGMLAGVLTYAPIPIIIEANRICPPSLVWAMVNMGLLIPIVLSTFLLGEPFRPATVFILLAFTGMLVAFHKGIRPVDGNKKEDGFRAAKLLTAILLVCGLQMFAMKLNVVFFPGVPSGRFSAVMFGVAAALAGLYSAMKPGRMLNRNELCWGGIAGLTCGAAILLLLPTMMLPAAVAFPVIQGASLLGGVFLLAMVFRERMNIWKILGVVLGLAILGLAVAA